MGQLDAAVVIGSSYYTHLRCALCPAPYLLVYNRDVGRMCVGMDVLKIEDARMLHTQLAECVAGRAA